MLLEFEANRERVMGLDELVSRIELLRERVRLHGAELRENETRTRLVLIDPLLFALGWDVSDPEAVMPEYKTKGGTQADYALLRSDGRPAVIVEAKKLGAAKSSHHLQMLNYANMSGIEYAGLTDGDRWELYSVFERGRLEERRILEVSIINMPVHESALKLLLLWRPNVTSGKPASAAEPIFGMGSRELPPEAPVPAPSPAQSNWVVLSEYNPPAGTPYPAAIRFWDGSELRLQKWYEILTSVVEKLYAGKRLTMKDLPIGWSNKVYSVHTEAIHPNGKEFVSARQIEGTPLFVNVHLSAAGVRRNTKRILEFCRLDPTSVHLLIEE